MKWFVLACTGAHFSEKMVERLGVIWFQFSAIHYPRNIIKPTFRQSAAVFFSGWEYYNNGAHFYPPHGH